MKFVAVILVLSTFPVALADNPQLVLKGVECPQSPAGKFSLSWEARWSGMNGNTQIRFVLVDSAQRQLIIQNDTAAENGSRRWIAQVELPSNISLLSGYSFALEAYWKGSAGWEATQDKSWRIICAYPSLMTAQPVTNVVTPITAPAQQSNIPTSSQDLVPLIIIMGATLLTVGVIITRRRGTPRRRRADRNIFRRRR